MSRVELYIFIQPGCGHCKEVEPEINYIKTNFSNVTIMDLNRNDSNYKAYSELALKYGVIGTPSAVIIENDASTLYGGKENFENNHLAFEYKKAIDRNKVIPTTAPGDNVKVNPSPVVDPPPPSNNNKKIAIGIGITLLFLLLK